MEELKSFNFGFKKIKFTPFTGDVLDSENNLEETLIQTGGLAVTNSMGMTTTVGSRTRRKIKSIQELWLKSDSGEEKHFSLDRCNVPMREGHKATVINMQFSRQEYPCCIVNHNTKQVELVGMDKAVKKLFSTKWYLWLLLASAVFYMTGYIGFEETRFVKFHLIEFLGFKFLAPHITEFLGLHVYSYYLTEILGFRLYSYHFALFLFPGMVILTFIKSLIAACFLDKHMKKLGNSMLDTA